MLLEILRRRISFCSLYIDLRCKYIHAY